MKKRQWYRCPCCRAEYPRRLRGGICNCGTQRPTEKIVVVPDIEALLEERNRPTYREEAIMEHGIEIREEGNAA